MNPWRSPLVRRSCLHLQIKLTRLNKGVEFIRNPSAVQNVHKCFGLILLKSIEMGTNEDNSVTSVIIKTCAPVDVQEFERSASKFDNSELLLI